MTLRDSAISSAIWWSMTLIFKLSTYFFKALKSSLIFPLNGISGIKWDLDYFIFKLTGKFILLSVDIIYFALPLAPFTFDLVKLGNFLGLILIGIFSALFVLLIYLFNPLLPICYFLHFFSETLIVTLTKSDFLLHFLVTIMFFRLKHFFMFKTMLEGCLTFKVSHLSV